MRISLVEVALVDQGGVAVRLAEDREQLQLPSVITQLPPDGFKDWGLVTFQGVEYYMSSYTPAVVPEEEELD